MNLAHYHVKTDANRVPPSDGCRLSLAYGPLVPEQSSPSTTILPACIFSRIRFQVFFSPLFPFCILVIIILGLPLLISRHIRQCIMATKSLCDQKQPKPFSDETAFVRATPVQQRSRGTKNARRRIVYGSTYRLSVGRFN
jgi:hypothetical protein